MKLSKEKPPATIKAIPLPTKRVPAKLFRLENDQFIYISKRSTGGYPRLFKGSVDGRLNRLGIISIKSENNNTIYTTKDGILLIPDTSSAPPQWCKIILGNPEIYEKYPFSRLERHQYMLLNLQELNPSDYRFIGESSTSVKIQERKRRRVNQGTAPKWRPPITKDRISPSIIGESSRAKGRGDERGS